MKKEFENIIKEDLKVETNIKRRMRIGNMKYIVEQRILAYKTEIMKNKHKLIQMRKKKKYIYN